MSPAPRRLYIEQPVVAGTTLSLTGENHHYVAHVLRLGPGAALELFDGRGQRASATLTRLDEKNAFIMINSLFQEPPPRCELTLAVAAPKGERADWLVEKAAELGVWRLVWLGCARSVAHPRGGATSRQQRWQRLATAAARQAGRAVVMEVLGPVAFPAYIEKTTAACMLVCDPGGSPWTHGVPQPLPTSMVAVVGPEGGLTQDELQQAKEARYTAVGLGHGILRVETAAMTIAALAMQAAYAEEDA